MSREITIQVTVRIDDSIPTDEVVATVGGMLMGRFIGSEPKVRSGAHVWAQRPAPEPSEFACRDHPDYDRMRCPMSHRGY